MKITARFILGLAGTALLAAGCASLTPLPSPQELDKQATAMMHTSFREEGIAKLDRLDQDAAQAACSHEKPPAD
ncbi:MAG TPA: hypothetical protein VGQ91_03025, partial [Ideonella sp.]|nr:hypothetical protein [Ideonella sp.]